MDKAPFSSGGGRESCLWKLKGSSVGHSVCARRLMLELLIWDGMSATRPLVPRVATVASACRGTHRRDCLTEPCVCLLAVLCATPGLDKWRVSRRQRGMQMASEASMVAWTPHGRDSIVLDSAFEHSNRAVLYGGCRQRAKKDGGHTACRWLSVPRLHHITAMVERARSLRSGVVECGRGSMSSRFG